jgi:hypothetical protein
MPTTQDKLVALLDTEADTAKRVALGLPENEREQERSRFFEGFRDYVSALDPDDQVLDRLTQIQSPSVGSRLSLSRLGRINLGKMSDPGGGGDPDYESLLTLVVQTEESQGAS